MTATIRDLIAGSVAALGLLVGMFIWTMPWWLAIGLAMGLYIGLRLGLPATPSDHEVIHAGGVTEAERQTVLTDGNRQLTALRKLADRLQRVRPGFTPTVQELCRVVQAILHHIERKPDGVRFATMVPWYLDQINTNLDRYLNLAQRHGSDATAQTRLAATEDMVRSATQTFTALQDRLSKEDWMALEVEAESLKTLFDTELP